MQENHKKYPKLCVYWVGPFVPLVITANVEIMKTFLHQSGGLQEIVIIFCISTYVCMLLHVHYQKFTSAYLLLQYLLHISMYVLFVYN